MANEFRFTKQEIADRDRRIEDAREKFKQLQASVEEFNQEIVDARENVDNKLTEYTDALNELTAFFADMESVNQERYDEKSDKWQEGDRASSVQTWIDSLGAFSFDAPEIDFPEPIEVETCDAIDEAAELDTEV